MVGVFVAFIRVVYGRMIYMSLPGELTTIQSVINQHKDPDRSFMVSFFCL